MRSSNWSAVAFTAVLETIVFAHGNRGQDYRLPVVSPGLNAYEVPHCGVLARVPTESNAESGTGQPTRTRLQTVIEHRGSRPGNGWHRHGWTVRTLTIRIGQRLQRIVVRKQRWRHVATGKTQHDRPAWELPWSSATIDVAFYAVATRLLAGMGELEVPLPWSAADSPSDRTVLRWLNRLRADALAWQHAIRLAVLNRLVPRPLEEILPPGGVPPPAELRYRLDRPTAQLVAAMWFLVEARHHVNVAAHTLLVEARRDAMTAL